MFTAYVEENEVLDNLFCDALEEEEVAKPATLTVPSFTQHKEYMSPNVMMVAAILSLFMMAIGTAIAYRGGADWIGFKGAYHLLIK